MLNHWIFAPALGGDWLHPELNHDEGERVISGLQRTPAHRHLLHIGYIKEQPMSGQNVRIAVTAAGRKAPREA